MKHRVYIASKALHASSWKALQNSGYTEIQCRWFNYSSRFQQHGESPNYVKLWDDCLEDVMLANTLIMYCGPGEVLKGALIEIGIALASDTQIILVAEQEDLERNVSWWQHRSMIRCDSVYAALDFARQCYDVAQRK